jgi:hypothetical protein
VTLVELLTSRVKSEVISVFPLYRLAGREVPAKFVPDSTSLAPSKLAIEDSMLDTEPSVIETETV